MRLLFLKANTHASKTLNQGFQNTNHACDTYIKENHACDTPRLQERQKKLVKAGKTEKKEHATVLANSL